MVYYWQQNSVGCANNGHRSVSVTII